jgi:hypothetical protein
LFLLTGLFRENDLETTALLSLSSPAALPAASVVPRTTSAQVTSFLSSLGCGRDVTVLLCFVSVSFVDLVPWTLSRLVPTAVPCPVERRLLVVMALSLVGGGEGYTTRGFPLAQADQAIQCGVERTTMKVQILCWLSRWD